MSERGVVGTHRRQRVDGRRQARSAGQVRQSLAPPGGVLLAFRLSSGVVLRQVSAVVEGEFTGLVAGRLVEAAQVGQEDPQAQRVTGHHVQVDLQPGPAVGEQTEGHAEDVAGNDVGARVGVALAQQLQLGLCVDGGVLAQVVDSEGGGRRAETLPSLLVEDRPQHAVPQHERPYGGVEPGGVDLVAVEFDVEVRGDATEGLSVLAADPVGVLHRRQWERLRPPFRRHRVERDGWRGDGCLDAFLPPQQGRPRGQGRSAGEVLEGDRAAFAPPGADQGHQHQ
ncbi:hypothetical protein RKD38_001689 [Streptomyces ambofaciens]